ncbi:oxidoreductase [Deinococcus humi]|nr:oxidoreductase [Deinococcus humi]
MQSLNLRVPIILAPMAGGVSTPELVAAVSDAGGLGSLGAAYLTPAQILEAGAAVRRLTGQPFAVNLFAPQPAVDPTPLEVERAIAELAPFHADLALPPPTLTAQGEPDFRAQLEAVLEVCPAVLSFTFGRLEPRDLDALRTRGILAIGTATGLEEARQLEADGVDAIVLQGGTAGGHRGGWLEDELADTLALTRVVASHSRVPLIAAGGLMTAPDVRAALQAGASLAQCGTAFLRAAEAGTSAPYRAALAAARAGDTVLTRAFSGRTARGLQNAVTQGVTQPLPYPHQNALTRPMRAAGARVGRAEVLSLWAGEGVAQGQEGPAAQILAGLWP